MFKKVKEEATTFGKFPLGAPNLLEIAPYRLSNQVHASLQHRIDRLNISSGQKSQCDTIHVDYKQPVFQIFIDIEQIIPQFNRFSQIMLFLIILQVINLGKTQQGYCCNMPIGNGVIHKVAFTGSRSGPDNSRSFLPDTLVCPHTKLTYNCLQYSCEDRSCQASSSLGPEEAGHHFFYI